MSLPSFIVVGGRRCGTTSLYHWISSHPDIWMYPETDTAFFIDNEINGRTKWLDGQLNYQNWDQDHSIEEYIKRFSSGNSYEICGEKSADLLFWTHSHSRLARYLPECKFIIQLRNPVKRAWSHYWNDLGKGRENLTFEKAIELERNRSLNSDYARFHLSYKERGNYSKSLEQFLKHIPRENVLILIFEETIKNPKAALEKIYDFIGVDKTKGLDIAGSQHNSNWTMVKRSWVYYEPFSLLESYYRKLLRKLIARLWVGDKEKQSKKRKFLQKAELLFRKPAKTIKLLSHTEEYLNEYYKTDIEKLEKLLGRDLDIWKK